MTLPTDARVVLVRGSRAEAHEALHTLVAELAGVDDASVTIVQRCPDCGGPHGRPVVMAPQEARDIGVSLAHAGEWSVVAAMQGARVGVDVEQRETPPERTEALRTLLQHGTGDPLEPATPAMLRDAPDLLQRWTRIEAVLKADGRGLRVEPSDVVLESTAGGLTASVPGSSRCYAVHRIDLDHALVVSLAIGR